MNREQQQSPYRLAFVDLDDTLLGPRKDIGRANLGALHRLRAAGVQIAIASGRHHNNITGLAQLGQKDWILSSHGSVVRHEQTREVLAEVNMTPSLVRHLCDRARELEFSVIVYHRDGAYIERDSKWTDLYAREAGWIPKRADFATLEATGIQKVLWSDHPDRIQQWAPALKEEFADRLNVLVTNPELLEFFSLTANKAIGAQTLARKLRIRCEETLAFGDGNNDVELLRWAGLSVAMNHGRETARRAARLVSPPGPPESAFARAVDLTFSSSC
ncbi:MAG: hypothetical protein QOE70_4152 [Chthoniobacter sp.]|jgi:Cof subfamily protein (haloacid dehalogenase superfamily)|nr:hypothetical protein [Chthoniobacter sp.]